MAKGNIAKQKVAAKIAEAFGSAFVGEFDKKLYIWSEEDGEAVQVAITMTCPKVPVGSANKVNYSAEVGDALNFENMSAAAVPQQPATITEEEQKNIEDLMKKLGL